MASDQEQYHAGLAEVKAGMTTHLRLTAAAKERADEARKKAGLVLQKYLEVVALGEDLREFQESEVAPTHAAAHQQLREVRAEFKDRFPRVTTSIIRAIAQGLEQLDGEWKEGGKVVENVTTTIVRATIATNLLRTQEIMEAVPPAAGLLSPQYEGFATHAQAVIEQIDAQTGIT